MSRCQLIRRSQLLLRNDAFYHRAKPDIETCEGRGSNSFWRKTSTPILISRNEIAVAQTRSDDWHLMRVWNLARERRAFALRPPLDTHVELTATSFLATFR